MFVTAFLCDVVCLVTVIMCPLHSLFQCCIRERVVSRQNGYICA